VHTRRARRAAFSWPALLALGWAVYELTAQAPLGVAPLCLKLGWADFATALWLRRKDPSRERAGTHFWLFLALGLWKAATLALTLLVVVGCVQAVIADAAGPPAQAQAPAELVEALVTAYLGYAACLLATCLGLRLAWRFRIKVWLDPGWDGARRDGHWPPSAAAGRSNAAGRLILTALLVFWVGFILLPLEVAGLLVLLPAFPPNQGTTWPYVAFGLVLFVGVGLPAIRSSIFLHDLLLQRVVAASPDECWGVPAGLVAGAAVPGEGPAACHHGPSPD
jgi:hypothetical protein